MGMHLFNYGHYKSSAYGATCSEHWDCGVTPILPEVVRGFITRPECVRIGPPGEHWNPGRLCRTATTGRIDVTEVRSSPDTGSVPIHRESERGHEQEI